MCGVLNSCDYDSKKERLTGDTTIKNYGLKDLPLMHHEQYRRNGYDDNADAQMQRDIIVGREIVVVVAGGQLVGTWGTGFFRRV